MGFRSATTYNEQKYGNKFVLQNDGDFAEVVFLYKSQEEVLIADAHYIKSADYNGYVHCVGHGCPACEKNIRVQQKLFIPMYNITAGEIQFWDRYPVFLPQLTKDVFSNFPDPSGFVFRITRNGAAGDRNTRYTIAAVGKNPNIYNQIMTQYKVVMPDYYEHIIKDASVQQLTSWLAVNSPASATYNGELPDYTPQPRVSVTTINQDTVSSAVASIGDYAPLDSNDVADAFDPNETINTEDIPF